MRVSPQRISTLLIAFVLLGVWSQADSQSTSHQADAKIKKEELPHESFEQLATKAQTEMEAEHIPEAIRLYAEATKLRPDWSEGWWHLGTMLFDTGKFGEAKTAFGDFVNVEHKQPGPGFAMLGLSEFHLKEYPQALSTLEHSLNFDLGNNLEFNRAVLYHDGILNTKLNKSEIAIVRLTRASNMIAAAHPEAPHDAVFADGELLDALGIAGLHMAKLPSELPQEQLPLVREAGRVKALVTLQDRVAADSEFQQLLTLFPSTPGVHYMYGVFLLKERPALAADQFRREVEVAPSDPAPRLQLAFAALEAADYDQGLKYAKDAVALSPNNFVVHVVCGRLLLAMNKPEDALLELRTAVQLAPDSPDAHFALSRALSQAGRSTEAAHERETFERLKARADKASLRQ